MIGAANYNRWPIVDNVNDDAKVLMFDCLLHKHVDRALLLVTDECFHDCFYCCRSEWKRKETRFDLQIDKALHYIKNTDCIKEVILSGGDAFKDLSAVRYILKKLNDVPHVKSVRLATREPVLYPDSFVYDALSLCGVFNGPVRIVTAFNTADELSQDSVDACKEVSRKYTILNQTVLIHGVNAVYALDEFTGFCYDLVNCGVIPYYVYQPNDAEAYRQLQIPVCRGIQFMDHAKVNLPGYAVPKYVAYTSAGKIELCRENVLVYDDNVVYLVDKVNEVRIKTGYRWL